jgi:hypothetical protein
MAKLMHLFLTIIILSQIILIPSATALACIQSSDDYATEVLLNQPAAEYNLNFLSNAKNVIFRENKYTYLSHYNDKLLVIVSEVLESEGVQPGLSVKIQMPTISEKENAHVLQLISKSVKGEIIAENVSSSSFEGWSVDCTNERIISECKFLMDGTSMRAYLEGNDYNIELEISDSTQCDNSCSGYCVRSGGSSTCITAQKRASIESVLKNSGLIRDFNEFISAYSIVRNGPTPTTTLKADFQGEVDWRKAMKEELTWLKSQDIIRLLNDDIEKVSALAMQGASGHNNRIVYAKDKLGVPGWIYYKDSVDPLIIFDKECTEFVVSPGITGGVVFESGDSRIYYLLPLFIIIISILVFALIVTFTRWNHERRKNTRKAIDNEVENVSDKKSIRGKSGI